MQYLHTTLYSVSPEPQIHMEKGKTSAVFLTQRDSGHVGQELQKVNWDNLVDDVFKEEVDQFFIESGVNSLQIRQIMGSNLSIKTTLSSRPASPSSLHLKNSKSKQIKK